VTQAPAEPRPGLREPKKARTRTQIRETALRRFAQQGYEATTVGQIAEAADVSLSTLFRYFPTKAQLVLSIDLSALVRAAFRTTGPADTVFDCIGAAMRACFPGLTVVGPTGDPEHERALTTLENLETGMRGLEEAFRP
jgi:AcrR family transcriptional regulator